MTVFKDDSGVEKRNGRCTVRYYLSSHPKTSSYQKSLFPQIRFADRQTRGPPVVEYVTRFERSGLEASYFGFGLPASKVTRKERLEKQQSGTK